MSPLPDHYAILGVAKDAQIPEIRSAHRKLVLKCHPDKVQDPTLKAEKQDEFQKVQTAYEVLSNEKERRRYDDSLRLAELKAQLQNKANSSAPRKYDIKVSESRSSHKPASGSPNVRVFTTYSPGAAYDEEKRSRSQSRSRSYYDHEPRHSSKREASYTEKPSKREAEREREREREREKEKEQREKERRRREKKEREEEELRRAQKKEKKEKKEREKAKSKDIKKGTEEKRQERYAEDIYVEHEEEYIPKPEKKKSSSKKHEEKRERERDRSVHRDEPSPRFPDGSHARSFAQEYIRMARREDPVYYSEKPSAPTPPPLRSGPHSPPKDDDIRRSSARRASPEGYKEKSRRKASREQLDDDEDEVHISASPPKYATSPPTLNRTNSVPVTSSSRPIPVGRSKTFANYGDGGESPRSDRGRHRSKHHAQPTLDEVVSDSEEDHDHDRRHRERKHRSSKKHRSPEGPSEFRYHVDGGRSHLYSTSYSFANRADYEPTASFSTSPYYPEFDHPTRPSMHARDSGYGGSGSYYDRVKTSKSYGVDDIAFSSYPSAAYGGEYPVQA
ncbi:hypothetical protein V2G26_020143 [Clonostachys chloroleuca]|uniref:J domain-containing protein n=1 Tax=Clonostachys chloroleuca TaxID=1926264 RepID=A0AA35Q0Z9_9HYPO|nr:unnamed protein product [Clonostachys chloroleuca]